MLNNLDSFTVIHALAIDPSDTNGATSAFIDVKGFEGQIGVMVHNGIIGAGGSVAYTFQTATDDEGTGVAAVVPVNGALTTASEANEPLAQLAVFNVEQLKGFLKVIGTVTTDSGPTTYTIFGQKKYAT